MLDLCVLNSAVQDSPLTECSSPIYEKTRSLHSIEMIILKSLLDSLAANKEKSAELNGLFKSTEICLLAPSAPV